MGRSWLLCFCLLCTIPFARTLPQTAGQAYGYSPASQDSAAQVDSAGPGFVGQIHVSLMLGYKLLDEQWEPAREQVEFGLINADVTPQGWPFGLAAQILIAYSPALPRLEGVEGDHTGGYAFNLGVRKLFDPEGPLQPYVSFGFGALGASTKTSVDPEVDVDESIVFCAGVWVDTGVYWLFSETNLLGVSVQYSSGNLQFYGHPMNPGGFHALVQFGWYW